MEISKRITSLRFIMILLVVFIHNSNPDNASGIMKSFQIIFGLIIAKAAVPLFFIISGYLLFCKTRNYIPTIQTKIRTLLIPYLFWNLLTFLFFLVLNQIGYSYGADSYNLQSFGEIFWANSKTGYPIAYQLWFLRDLIIVTLLYSAGKWLIDTVPFVSLCTLSLLWLFDIALIGIHSESLLFFFLGYYIIKYKESFKTMTTFQNYLGIILYVLCIGLELILLYQNRNIFFIHKLNMLLGCWFLFSLSKWLIQKEKLYYILNKLSVYSFFIYAFHEPFLSVVRKLLNIFLIGNSFWIQFIGYFLPVLIVVAGSILIGRVIQAVNYKFYCFINGFHK